MRMHLGSGRREEGPRQKQSVERRKKEACKGSRAKVM